MATSTTNRSLCDKCGKAKGISKCEGCSKIFCYNHFVNHRQELNQKLDELEVSRDIFHQTLTEQIQEPQKRALIQEINKWEQDSINKIRKAAEEARELALEYTAKHIAEIEVKLSKVNDQLRQSRQENDFVETDLLHWTEELIQLTKELPKPSNITLRQESKPLATKIYVKVSTISSSTPNVDDHSRWKQNGITVAGGNSSGNWLNQLNAPCGLCIDDDDQTVYIADRMNHRVVEWKYGAMSGNVIAGGNGQGNRSDQLMWPTDVILDKQSDSLIISDAGNKRIVRWPRQNGIDGQTIISDVSYAGLAMDNDGYVYVSDCQKHEVRKWKIGDCSGILVAGGNEQGERLDQLNTPGFIYVDQNYSLYISDENNHRIMKWIKGATEGIVVAGGQGEGNSLSQLSRPRGLIIDQLDNIYIADYPSNRVVRWKKGATQGTVIAGGKGEGTQPDQLYFPQDLSFDQQGNLYVIDLGNQRVQRFDIMSNSSSQ